MARILLTKILRDVYQGDLGFSPFFFLTAGLRIKIPALAGLLSGLEHCPIHQKVVGSIPGQGTYVGSRYNAPPGMYRRQLISVCLSHRCFSLYLFLPPPLSKISKHILE